MRRDTTLDADEVDAQVGVDLRVSRASGDTIDLDMRVDDAILVAPAGAAHRSRRPCVAAR